MGFANGYPDKIAETWHDSVVNAVKNRIMKKYIFTGLAFLLFSSAIAQDNGDKKAMKKQEKLEQKSTSMEKANRKGDARRSVHKMRKMEKKEKKMNNKADKSK